MTALTLGPVDFEAFEVPGRIAFGGGQRLAVHALPGGVRLVDAMGRDDAPIIWSGVFTGENAGERVRLLDLLRAAGEPLPLAWDDFLFIVVIAGFEARFEQPNWIPYRIACVVLSDLAIPDLLVLPLLGQLNADIGAAAFCPGLDLTAASAALAQPLAATSGTAAYSQSATALGAAVGQVDGLMASGSAALDRAGDVDGTAAAAGQLAQASAAQGYLRRAQANLGRAGS